MTFNSNTHFIIAPRDAHCHCCSEPIVKGADPRVDFFTKGRTTLLCVNCIEELYNMVNRQVLVPKESVQFRGIPSYGERLELKEFKTLCKTGMFSDFSGVGELACEDDTSYILIRASQAASFDYPDWCTHIVWYRQ